MDFHYFSPLCIVLSKPQQNVPISQRHGRLWSSFWRHVKEHSEIFQTTPQLAPETSTAPRSGSVVVRSKTYCSVEFKMLEMVILVFPVAYKITITYGSSELRTFVPPYFEGKTTTY